MRLCLGALFCNKYPGPGITSRTMQIDWLYLGACGLVLLITYLITITYTSVFYHRAFTHGAVKLRPWFRKFVIATGPWVTGMDIKAWTCMHRLHHRYSDTKRDPHSPVYAGFWGVLVAQLRGYERVVAGLQQGRRPYTSVVSDLDFPLSWGQRHKGLWWVPFAILIGIGLGLAVTFDAYLLGGAFVFGMMSHPIQGFIINSFGHARGHRNFERPDNSRNNVIAALLVLGEGLQNNHHAYPSSARFSFRSWEFDGGYLICRMLEKLRCLDVYEAGLIPKPAALAV